MYHNTLLRIKQPIIMYSTLIFEFLYQRRDKIKVSVTLVP